ncbi:MAG: DUF2187 family protein [Caryophanon sp.]|nr:DUF2187 family protein [Caryophanon sp.]
MTATVKIGDHIRFTKDKVTLEGTVEIIYENSVMVIIHPAFHEKAQRFFSNERTIISHKKYEIL